MDRNDVFKEIAVIARGNPSAALWALGYLSVGLPTETLEDLLAGLREFPPGNTGSSHYAAYLERWGVIPGRKVAD